MESLWRMCSHWQQAGYCYSTYPPVVHLHIFSHTGFAHCALHDPCFLDEYQALYLDAPPQSAEMAVDIARDKDEYVLLTPLGTGEIKKRLQDELSTSSPNEFGPFRSDYTFQSTATGFKLTKAVPTQGRSSASVTVTGVITPTNNGSSVMLRYQRNGTNHGIRITILIILVLMTVSGIIYHVSPGDYVGILVIISLLSLTGISKKGLRGEMYMLHTDITRILS